MFVVLTIPPLVDSAKGLPPLAPVNHVSWEPAKELLPFSSTSAPLQITPFTLVGTAPIAEVAMLVCVELFAGNWSLLTFTMVVKV